MLPVPWYAAGELHLSDVVVELPGIDSFVADDDEVVALMTTGAVKVVRADGDVDDLDTAEEAAIDLGATKHPDQPGTSYRVFLDPAGHPFCLCLE